MAADALFLADTSWSAAQAARARALNLALRGREYCLRALERSHPGIRASLAARPETAVGDLQSDELPLIFWSGASWGAAVSLGVDRPEILIDLPAVRALIGRALVLDEAWQRGAVHELMIPLEALPAALGGSSVRARRHLERALELAGGDRAGPLVTFAESVAVGAQDRTEFVELLERALAVDPDREPQSRLATLLAQRRARFLIDHADDYFFE